MPEGRFSCSLTPILKEGLQLVDRPDQDLPCLRTVLRPDDSRSLQLVHDASGLGVSRAEPALDVGS